MSKRKKKNSRIIIEFLIAVIILIAGVYYGWDYIPKEYTNKIQEELKQASVHLKAEDTKQIETKVDGNLTVYYIDVGQADCILMKNQNQSMLIDAGNNEDGERIVNYLKAIGIKKIDYLVGTHPHEDHIGGLDTVIRNFDIGTVYLPDVTTNTKTYEDVLDAMIEKNLQITVPKIGDRFKVGEAQNEIVWTASDSKNLNNCSIVIKTIYGKQSFLFTGDAEELVETKMKLSEANVLKVGHHGSSSSTSQTLLNKVKPKYAIISVGKDNDYGHPTKKILDRLNQYGCEIHRTDVEGTIIVTTDGENINITSEKTDTNGN